MFQHIQIYWTSNELMFSEELEMLFKEMADRPRRTDMVNAAKNVSLDMDAWINAVKIAIKHHVNWKLRWFLLESTTVCNKKKRPDSKR